MAEKDKVEEGKLYNEKIVNLDNYIRENTKIIQENARNIMKEQVKECKGTPDDWDSCRVEKMGCDGCYYYQTMTPLKPCNCCKDNSMYMGKEKMENMIKSTINDRHTLAGLKPIKNIEFRKGPDGRTEIIQHTEPKQPIEEVKLDTDNLLLGKHNIDGFDAYLPLSCMHCGEGTPLYCENCYQELIADNARMQYKIICTNTIREYLDAMKNILISGELAEKKLQKLMTLYIQYNDEFRERG
jgi:hypothetical protein